MILSFILLSSLTSTSPEAIYGDDNRHEVFEEKNSLIRTSAHSTAALIEKTHLKTTGTSVTISGKTLGSMYQLCEDQKFRRQPIAANCSGTLVAPDIIMTAAHCYDLGKEICKNNSWVFNYRVLKENQSSVTIDQNHIYGCKEILYKEYSHEQGIDYALIKLDRVVTDRPPVALQKQEVKLDDPLVLIGHPSGLPTKIADGATVQNVSENHFISNLDAFTVNSGSGVFNPVTGEVLGILASGRKDYEPSSGCTVTKTYRLDEGNELVINLKKVAERLKLLK